MKLPFGLKFNRAEDKYKLSSAIELIVLLTGLVLANLIIFSFNWQLDFTEDKLYSLNPTTTNYLSKLDKPVDLFFLANAQALDNSEIGQIDLILKLMASKNSLIKYKLVDPNLEPDIVNQFNKDGQNNLKMGTLIVRSGKISKILDFLNLISYRFDETKTPQSQSLNVENSVLSALQFLDKGQQLMSYNILGHGEVSFEELIKAGERSFLNALDDYNYQIAGLTLANKTIPADAKLLFILSPKTDLDPSEKVALSTYLEQGGSLVVNLDLSENQLPILYSLLTEYGITPTRSLVTEHDMDRLWIEANSNPIFFAVEFPSNPINQAINAKKGTIFVGATSNLEATQPQLRTITTTPLMQSSAKAKIIPINSDTTGNPIEKQATVAMLSQKKVDEKTTASLVVLTGRADIMQKFDGPYWFGQLLSYLNNDKNYLQVENKSLVELPIRYKSVVIVFVLAVVFVLIVPTSLISMAIITYFRRKKL